MGLVDRDRGVVFDMGEKGEYTSLSCFLQPAGPADDQFYVQSVLNVTKTLVTPKHVGK